MIRINLLPHREQKRKERRQQFFVLAGLISVLAALIVFLVYSVIGSYISTQDERNDFLKREIAVLDKQLEEIKRLKEQTAALLSRKQIIEALQGDRAEAVHLLNELAKQVPEGIFLKSMKQQGNTVTLQGVTQSNARVSALMRNIDASPWMERPVLVEIKTANLDKRRVSEFTMTFMLKRAAATDATGGKK